MQDIAKVRDEFRINPKALEKAPISSNGSKQNCVEAGSVTKKL